MATVESGQFHLAAHEKYGDGIPATVRGVHAFADYHSGWADADFMYESPRIVLELDTEMGNIHADMTITNIVEGNFHALIDGLLDADDGAFDFKDLIDREVTIAPNDDFTRASLWPPESTESNAYVSKRSVVLQEPERTPVSREADDHRPLGTESRSLAWLNRQLMADHERHVGAHGRWLERTVDAVREDGDEIVVTIEVLPGWRARWEFDASLSGHLSFREFAKGLGYPPSVDGLEGSLVYLCPVRDLHHTLPRSEYPLDALERWAIAGSPDEPQPPKKSLLDRLRSVFTFPQPSVDVSVGGRTRNAKSSDSFDVPDECRDADPVAERAAE